jgi:hypothetical protein
VFLAIIGFAASSNVSLNTFILPIAFYSSNKMTISDYQLKRTLFRHALSNLDLRKMFIGGSLLGGAILNGSLRRLEAF